MSVVRCLRVAVVLLIVCEFAWGGFASSEQFLPAVGDLTLAGGTRALTTIWATNLSGTPVSFTFSFLKQGQANASPAQFTDNLAVGETKVYENVVETKLGLANVLGAARVVSTGEILVAERIFNQAPGADLGTTQGLFFAGVPKGFSISAGQSASIQGLNQGGAENFRYNFALVETGGGNPTVNVQVFDGSGTLLGQKAFPLSPFEQLQPNVTEVVPGFASINARLTATVTGGTGSVLLAGAQVANESLDSSGFEMSFRGDLLGGGGTAGVTSLNGLTGAITLAHGANTTVNVNGQTITIDAVSGSGTGLTSVAHDNSLTGSGTVAIPLAIANGQVVRSVNGLHDNITLAAGTNVTITPSGSTLTIAASGSGGGGLSAVSHDFTLAGDGTGAHPLGLAVPVAVPIAISGGQASPFITVSNNAGPSIEAHSSNGDAIVAQSDAGPAIAAGVSDGNGIDGGSGSGAGMFAHAASGIGIIARTNTGSAGVLANNGGISGLAVGFSAAIIGDSSQQRAVIGLSNSSQGVFGESTSFFGVSGQTQSTSVDMSGVEGFDGSGFSGIASLPSAGVRGESGTHFGVIGLTGSGQAGVLGREKTANADTAGVMGIDGTGASGQSGSLSAGVLGESSSHVGVEGRSGSGVAAVRGITSLSGASGSSAGVLGLVLASGVKGELGTRHSGTDWALFATGNINVTGTLTVGGSKSFAEPHPTDPTKEIRFVCLEGPESGTYFRGSGHIVGGFAKITVPESFRMVSDEKGLTVVATAVGGPGAIWVVKKDLNEIVLQASSDVAFDYMVNGVRRAYKDFDVIRENQLFVPDGPDDKRFAFYPPEIQRRLVATGIYNADGSVNLETAKRLGWDARWTKTQ